MKLYQITAGLLAVLSLVNSLVCLFTQPFASTQTNDTVFFTSFGIGCAFVALFLYASNQINGTINNPK